MFTTILVPIDGSVHAEKALGVAAELARSTSATLHLMTVTEYPPDDIGILAGGSAEPFSPAEREKRAEEMRKAGRALLAKARASAVLEGIEVKEVLREGRPGERIIEEAEAIGADAIVMGSRGMSDLKGLVVGSVSHRVSHTAACTVITVT